MTAFVVLLCMTRAGCSQNLSGHLDTKGYGFFEQTGPRDPAAIGWATLLVKEELPIGRVRLVASLRAEAISSAEAGELAFDPADRKLRRSSLSLRELSLRVAVATALDLQLGRFELGWGKTDGYSPADAFLPRDLSDPFANEKLPLWGGRLLGQRGAFRFEIVGVATTTPWRLPVLEGRYAPVPVAGVILVDGRSDPPRKGLWAARVLATRGNWDLGAWARAGTRPSPLFVFRSDQLRRVADGVELPVDRSYTDERGVGLELSRVLGAWVVRGEAAWLDSDDRELGDALLLSLGLERSVGDGTLLLTLSDNLRETPVAPALLLDRALLPGLVVAWNRNESWGGWKLVSTMALDRGDGLLKAEASVAITDRLTLEAGTDWPYGSRNGPLGALRAARRIRLGLRRSW